MWSYNYNNELYHYGVLGMKWGVRRNRHIVAPAKKERQPGWQRKQSEREKQWIDDHGFNPHRPNGTKPNSRQKLEKEVAKYNAKLKKGSLHNIAALALASVGLKKAARTADAKGDAKYTEWERRRDAALSALGEIKVSSIKY